jgi:hypothetical protein
LPDLPLNSPRKSRPDQGLCGTVGQPTGQKTRFQPVFKDLFGHKSHKTFISLCSPARAGKSVAI